MAANTTVRIDIREPLGRQFARDLNLIETNGVMLLDPSIGTGDPMTYVTFPDRMEFYHFGNARFLTPVDIKTVNAPDSEWLLIHINLSAAKQRKTVDGQTFEFQRRLPIGILIYGPDLEIDTLIPPNVESELASIRFNFSFLDAYIHNWRETIVISRNLVYEDLDYLLQARLDRALESMHNKMLCHANVLAFMNQLFDKIVAHDKQGSTGHLRSSEINSLFKASVHLRDPLATEVPSLAELAAMANMGTTKFKSAFKQLFGSAPMQYRNRIRMEYAREEIAANDKTPSELSYLLGYSHPSNFTAAYKKFFGELPSSIRNK